MDRATVQRRLTQAEARLTQVQKALDRQRVAVAEMEARGEDISEARERLQLFEELRISHVAECEQLRGELARLNDE